MFAIDGVLFPSHASKHRRGKWADFAKQATQLNAAATAMLARHREADGLPVESDLAAQAVARVEKLERDAKQLRDWLATHPTDRPGAKGAIRQSNRTDNESATMATSRGVIQGYTGVAAVDAKHQIVVEAQGHGTGSEQEVLPPVVTAIQPLLTDDTPLTADADYHREANLQHIAALQLTALIADPAMRKRDERLATQAWHQQTPDPLPNTTPVKQTPAVFEPNDHV